MCPFDQSKFDWDFRCHEVLLALLDVVSFRRELGELVPDLARNLQSVLPFDLFTVSLFNSSRGTMEMFRREGTGWLREPLEVPASESASGIVWRSQTIVLIDSLSEEKRFEAELRWLRDRELRSYCLLPLTTPRAKLGAIGFASRQLNAFGSADIHFLDRVSGIMTLCFEPFPTQAILEEEKARLRLLLEITSPQYQTQTLPQSVESILGSLKKWANQDQFGLYLYDEDAQSLRLHMADPLLAQKMAPPGLIPLDGSLAGQAFRTRRNVVLDHSTLSTIPFPAVNLGTPLAVRRLCLVPIYSQNGPLGVLKAARSHDQPFSAQHIELLERVAATIGPVLDRNTVVPAKPSIEAHADSLLDLAKALVSGSPVNRPGRVQEHTILAASESSGAAKPSWFGSPDSLLESEQLLVAYFKASKVGLCILDSDFRYLALNDTLAEMNGVPAPAHLGKTVREVLGQFAEVLETQFRKILATGEPILNLDVSSVLPTRTEPGYWIEHYIPIKDAAGQVSQIGMIAVEVTEQKRLEESLRGASEALHRERKRQEVLLGVARVLAERKDLSGTFPRISACLRRFLGQEYAALSLLEARSGRQVSQVIDFPLRKGPIPNGEVNPDSSLPGNILRGCEPLIFNRDDIRDSPLPTANNLLAEGLKSLCCVPLTGPEGLLGMLALGSTRVDAFKANDLTLLIQVADQMAIALENAANFREVGQLKAQLKRERRYVQGEVPANPNFEGLIGESAALRKVLDQISVVAQSNASVLLLGETGTGKGLAARALHNLSTRKKNALITLNCAAIPTGLLESELFGHEKGAFTGAVNQKVGRLELADGGTLFLDEIGEISSELQPKLLRVLQDHEFERLGGIKTIRVNVRLVAATNRDLARSVMEKEFRSDLFYRLNVFPIRLPSLRERRDDIPLLVRYFVKKYAARMDRVIDSVPSEAMDAMINWDWPGNIRELENFIERSVILSSGMALSVPLDELTSDGRALSSRSLEDAEREHILEVLRETRGVISGPAGAAARLGIKRTTLQSKMERLDIARQDYSDHGVA